MKIFVNNSIHNGILNYLNFINNTELNKVHIFEFWVIRILICIYGEINIINPFKLGKEDSFRNNLLLFGLKENEIDSFIKYMEEYDTWLNSKTQTPKTDLPNKINSILINMVLMKSLHQKITLDDLTLFDSFFNPTAGDMEKIRNLIVDDMSLIPTLWNRKRGQLSGGLLLDTIPPDLLSVNDYLRYGLSVNEVKQLSNLKVREINDKIISEDTESAEGGREKFDPKKLILTSGSGFVDTIVLLSIMATEIMIGLLIAFWFLRR